MHAYLNLTLDKKELQIRRYNKFFGWIMIIMEPQKKSMDSYNSYNFGGI